MTSINEILDLFDPLSEISPGDETPVDSDSTVFHSDLKCIALTSDQMPPAASSLNNLSSIPCDSDDADVRQVWVPLERCNRLSESGSPSCSSNESTTAAVGPLVSQQATPATPPLCVVADGHPPADCSQEGSHAAASIEATAWDAFESEQMKVSPRGQLGGAGDLDELFSVVFEKQLLTNVPFEAANGHCASQPENIDHLVDDCVENAGVLVTNNTENLAVTKVDRSQKHREQLEVLMEGIRLCREGSAAALPTAVNRTAAPAVLGENATINNCALNNASYLSSRCPVLFNQLTDIRTELATSSAVAVQFAQSLMSEPTPKVEVQQPAVLSAAEYPPAATPPFHTPAVESQRPVAVPQCAALKCDLQSEVELAASDCRYIDAHCHLDLVMDRAKFCGSFAQFKQLYSETWSTLYHGCVTNFCFPSDFLSKQSFIDIILKNEDVRMAIGCHPHQADLYNDQVEGFIMQTLSRDKVVAFGECGLDYSNKNKVNPALQQAVFSRQLKIAVAFGKPLVIHCRSAELDCLNIMKQVVPQDHPIHLHSFNGDLTSSLRWSGHFSRLYFGITSAICSPRSPSFVNFVERAPLNRLVVESDAPYFLPDRYKANEIQRDGLLHSHPGLCSLIVRKIAEIRQEPPKVLFAQILQNTRALYDDFID